MRTISKFSDYYDSGLAHGVDHNVVYARERIIVRNDNRNEPNKTEMDELYKLIQPLCYNTAVSIPQLNVNKLCRNSKGLPVAPDVDQLELTEVARGAIFFCGKSYPFYVIQKYRRKFMGADEIVETYFSFDPAADIKSKVRPSFWEDAKHWEQVLADAQGKASPVNELAKCPIVALLPTNLMLDYFGGGTPIILNPCLKELKFQHVFDPIHAFQEINMFIGSVLNNKEAAPAPQTDKAKVQSHGFDPKYGFRKTPK